MSGERSIKRVCLAGLYGWLLLFACFLLVFEAERLIFYGLLPPVEGVLAVAFFILMYYLFFVPPTLFVIVRGNFRVSVPAAFLIGAVQCSLVLLTLLPWERIVFSRFVVLPVASGLIGIFMVWYGELLRR